MRAGDQGNNGSQPEVREGCFRDPPDLLRVNDAYPPNLRGIWPFERFNAVQSAVYPAVAKSDRNVVVSAPTGCGKTAVLEMAVVRLLQQSGMSLGNQKIIYVAPIKALCQQTLDDWTAKFSSLGLRLAELTSDVNALKGGTHLRDLASADVVLTTPEKWDSVTRRWKEHAFLVGTVALVLTDEVHTIGEERGATLEIILTRMKAVSRSNEVVSKGLPASRMRFLALSATLPNAIDIGDFIGAEVFRFGEDFRPVPLKVNVLGYPSGSNPYLFDRGLNKHVPGILASLAVLVATTTLALGVNLPAHLVVIKGTNHYRGASGYKELPGRSDILQMVGRAGRPGFDSSGVAVVMTSKERKPAVESLGQEAVESSLQMRLVEALNSELSATGAIEMGEDMFTVGPTPAGTLFSRFMICFSSMKNIMKLQNSSGTERLLDMCASCEELKSALRRSEKKLLNSLNKSVRFPPDKKFLVRTPKDKALTLIKAALGPLPFDDWTMRGEQTSMLDGCSRLLGCCAELFAGMGEGASCVSALELLRSVRVKMWMDAELGQVRQIPGVGDQICNRLGMNGIITLRQAARASASQLEYAANRRHPFGQGKYLKVKHAALQILSRALSVRICRPDVERHPEQMEVSVEPAFQSSDPYGDDFMEAPNLMHTPGDSWLRRRDMHYQLVMYFN
ncbi:unnamed protein product, partial [Discosporangium mesarthrocarpum]